MGIEAAWRCTGSYKHGYKRENICITYTRGLITPLITADEPPNRAEGLEFRIVRAQGQQVQELQGLGPEALGLPEPPKGPLRALILLIKR